MEIDFDKMQGLAPAVIQDADTGELLMLGFMNQEASGNDSAHWVRDLLQSHATEIVDQGRNLWQSSAGG